MPLPAVARSSPGRDAADVACPLSPAVPIARTRRGLAGARLLLRRGSPKMSLAAQPVSWASLPAAVQVLDRSRRRGQQPCSPLLRRPLPRGRTRRFGLLYSGSVYYDWSPATPYLARVTLRQVSC